MGMAIPIASLALGAIGTVTSVIGAENAAAAQSRNAAYEAQVAQNNATTAANNAEYATQAGAEKATENSLKEREQQAQVVTGLAANGLDIGTGSAADVQKTQRETGALSTQQVVDNAALQAYGYRTQQTSFQAQSGLDTAQSGQAATAGNISALGGLLGGASSVGLNYTKLNQSGALGGSSGSTNYLDNTSTF